MEKIRERYLANVIYTGVQLWLLHVDLLLEVCGLRERRALKVWSALCVQGDP